MFLAEHEIDNNALMGWSALELREITATDARTILTDEFDAPANALHAEVLVNDEARP